MDRKLFNFIILVGICACLFQISAVEYSYAEALRGYDEENLKIPEPEADGRIQTLNKKGAVTAKFDDAAIEFLKFAEGKVVLEIGGTYGRGMLAALKRSKKTRYTLNDLDKRHLFIAAKILQEKINGINENRLTPDSTQQVRFIQGDVTNSQDIKKFDTFYEAIFIDRVLHYLTPEQLEITVKHLFLLLKPGGRIFVMAITPYVKRFEKFIPKYKTRVEAKEENPGFVKSLLEYVNTEVTTPEQIKNISDEPFFFLDDKILRTVYERNGFRVIECEMKPLRYPSRSWQLDGRENVMLIAEKP